MEKDTLSLVLRHEKFVQTICETAVVHVLKAPDGEFAASVSNYYDDENEEPIQVMCFWSDAELATSLIKHDWSDYQLDQIPLAEFLENWCVGMGNDEVIAGTDFDADFLGYEAEPYELILEIAAEFQKQNKTIVLENYESLDALAEQIREALGSNATDEDFEDLED